MQSEKKIKCVCKTHHILQFDHVSSKKRKENKKINVFVLRKTIQNFKMISLKYQLDEMYDYSEAG